VAAHRLTRGIRFRAKLDGLDLGRLPADRHHGIAVDTAHAQGLVGVVGQKLHHRGHLSVKMLWGTGAADAREGVLNGDGLLDSLQVDAGLHAGGQLLGQLAFHIDAIGQGGEHQRRQQRPLAGHLDVIRPGRRKRTITSLRDTNQSLP